MGCENLKSFIISKRNKYLLFEDGNLIISKDKTLVYSTNGATIPIGTSKICEGALANRSDTSVVYIPNSVVSIEPNAFGTTSSIKEVVFSPTNERFKFNNGNIITKKDSALVCLLGKSKISSDVRILSDKLFYNRQDIDSVSIPEGVRRIGRECFCVSSLTHISLPNSIREIGWRAFSHTKIETLEIPEGVERIEDNIGRCDNLRVIHVSRSVKIITGFAFSECSNLKTVYLKNRDTKIDNDVFPMESTVEIIYE